MRLASFQRLLIPKLATDLVIRRLHNPPPAVEKLLGLNKPLRTGLQVSADQNARQISLSTAQTSQD
jgi:hypothetical protein